MACATPREVDRPRVRVPPTHDNLLHEGDVNELGNDSVGLITPNKLFMSQSVRRQIEKPPEDGVRARVHQQLIAENSSDVVAFERGHPFFLQNAVTFIISHLQLQVKKNVWAGQRGSVWNRTTNFNLPNETGTDLKRSTDVRILAAVQPSTRRISLRHKNQSIHNQPQSSHTNAPLSTAGNSNEGGCKGHFRFQHTNHEIDVLKMHANLPHRSSADMSSMTRNTWPSPQGPPMWQNDAEITRDRRCHTPSEPVERQGGMPATSPTPQSSHQAQEDSEWAYGSVTEASESTHASVADTLDQPPSRADHQLLSRIAKPLLPVFLDMFDVWRGRPASSGRGTARPSATSGRGGVPSRKRVKFPPNGGSLRNAEEDYIEEDDDNVRNAGGRKRPRLDDSGLTLACPFFKKDMRTYGSCCGKRLTRIRDVKQHLKRRHYMPIYCPICYLIFGDEMSRDNHTNEFSCQRGRNPRPEGINLQQQNELGKRASRQLSEDQQWFGIFAILFPNDPPPSSAYIDPSLLDSADAYQDFVRSEGSGILYQFLGSRGALNWNVPRGLDLEAFQRQMLAEGLVAISEAWSREGVQAPTGRSGARPALSSENESVDVVNVGSGSPGAGSESVSSLHPNSTVPSADKVGYAPSHSEPLWQYQNPQQDPLPVSVRSI